jgi:adenylate cyclase, class 2
MVQSCILEAPGTRKAGRQQKVYTFWICSCRVGARSKSGLARAPDIYNWTMRRAAPNEEIEVKLRVSDVLALRLRLKQLRATQIVPRTFESNTLYDTPEQNLRRRGQLIRIRIEQSASKRNKGAANQSPAAILTYKGPAHRSPTVKKGAKERNRRYKIREEVEITLDGGEQMTRILRALCLRPMFQYEKFRTTYALPEIPNVKVELDETPIGLFLELEGEVSAIDRAARSLGYSRTDYISKTYRALYIADCRRRGIKSTDMLFQRKKFVINRTLPLTKI